MGTRRHGAHGATRCNTVPGPGLKGPDAEQDTELARHAHAREGKHLKEPLQNIFGKKSWDDVRGSLRARASRVWPGMPSEVLDDAVSAALSDLVSYWVGLESSLSGDSDKRFAFALWRGGHTMNTFLTKEWERMRTESPQDYSDFEQGYPDGPDNKPAWARSYAQRAFDDAASPDPYTELEREAQQERPPADLDIIPDEEWDLWLEDYMSGLTLKQVAAKHGVTKQAISKRNQAGLQRLRELFKVSANV